MYKFDDKKHMHTLDGIPLHGVTTVLSVISKPALIQWAANMATDYIRENVAYAIPDNVEGYWAIRPSIVDEAKTAHRKRKEKAGDFGTLVHKAIENWINERTETTLEDAQQKAFDNFVKWADENKVEFLESEKHVWSREHWIGGIVDGVLKMNGKKYVFDIKTSSGIYNEMFFQMAAYQICLEEMGEHEDIEGYLVINLKKDGTMQTKLAENMEVNRRAFLSALELHKILLSLK